MIPDDPNTVTMCELDHECVVCGKLTLKAKEHAARGSFPILLKACPAYFNVRCDECRHNQRMPDPALYKAWFELSNEEIEANYRPADRRKVFFEVI